jgi:type IV secretion system protein VirB9
MSRRRWLMCGVAAALGGCAERVVAPEIKLDPLEPKPARMERAVEPPVKVIEVPTPLPLPGQLKPLPKREVVGPESGTPAERIGAAHRAARVEPSKAGYLNAIQVYPYTAGALYQLYAAVNQVTDIALEVGEKLVSVSAGDTVRWIVGDTSSGEGTGAQVHILVKPIAPDITTNLVVTTDRRTYHLELHATASTYMASVSWSYPGATLTPLKGAGLTSLDGATAADRVGLDVANIRFRYRLEGEAPWKPLRVFDDGAKVFIQFPATLRQGEAPPLFVIDGSGKPALVNYRVKGATYVVDRLFAAAELRLGTAPQQVVRIVRIDAVWKERQG